MTIARASAAAALMLGIGMMATAALAQPAPQPTAPGAQPAAPAPAQPGEPAPTDSAAPPVLGPDGLPIAPEGAEPVAPPPPPPPPAEPEKKLEDITPITMFLGASLVVQVIMVMLIIWSVVTWALMFSKLSFFAGIGGKTDRFLNAFRSAGSLQDANKVGMRSFRDNPLARMLAAAVDEITAGGGKRGNLLSRAGQRMGIVQAEYGEELSTGMGIFATIGAIGAFVGLFGTVWGIMNSFIGIAQTQTTNLAVVAPGIAEALFATGLGLFAAVPAVIFYNMFARRIGAYQTRMDNFASEVLVRMSREFDG